MGIKSMLTVNGLTLEEYEYLKSCEEDLSYLIRTLNQCFKFNFDEPQKFRQQGESLDRKLQRLRNDECKEDDVQTDWQKQKKIRELTAELEELGEKYREAVIKPEVTIDLDAVIKILLSRSVRGGDFGIYWSPDEKNMWGLLSAQNCRYPEQAVIRWKEGNYRVVDRREKAEQKTEENLQDMDEKALKESISKMLDEI